MLIYSGLSIPAANAGKVVAVGNDPLLGNYIVIDHGLGIKTWYCHLSETDFALNETVAGGQNIGKTGSTGFTDTTGFFLMTTVNGVAVTPYDMQSGGIPLTRAQTVG